METKRPAIKLCEWFDDHFYKIFFDDGKVDYYPSYTTKLGAAPKPFLARWRGDVGNREADLRVYDAAEKGKRIHFACSMIADGGVVLYNPYSHPNFSKEEISEMQGKCDREIFILHNQDEMWQVAKFMEWLKIVSPEILGHDLIVADHENREAGTVDFLFRIKAGEYLVSGRTPIIIKEDGDFIADLKSGNEIYDEHFLQIAGYAKAYALPIAGSLIIHTNAKLKTGIEGLKTILRTSEEIETDYAAFRHIAAIWDRQNPDPTPKMIEFPNLLTLRSEI